MSGRASRRRPPAPRSTDYEEIVKGIFHLTGALQNLEMRLRKGAGQMGGVAEIGALAAALKQVMDSPDGRPVAEIDAVKTFLEKGTLEARSDALMQSLVRLAWRIVLDDLTPSAALEEANEARAAYGDPRSPARAPGLEEAAKRRGQARTRVSQVYSLLAAGSSARYQGETATVESATDSATNGGGKVRVRGGARGPLGALIDSVGERMAADIRERAKSRDGLVTSRSVVSPHGRQTKPLPSRKGRLPARGTPARNS